MTERRVGSFVGYAAMGFHPCSHPAAQEALGVLRCAEVSRRDFRDSLTRLASLLVSQATAKIPLVSKTASGVFGEVAVASASQPVFVPVLRAGAALLPGALSVWPEACVGFVGVSRNETDLSQEIYMQKIGDVADKHVVLLEPMLATGGSLCTALHALKEAGTPKTVSVVGVVASPEGVAHVFECAPEVEMYFAALDNGLNEQGYIVPGLGDAGDRAWGMTPTTKGSQKAETLP